jgi:hypothetical protein
MSAVGEFRLWSGCGQWAIWTPRDRKGRVYCCEACSRGLGCVCAAGPDERAFVAVVRRDLAQGGQHAIHR